MDQQAELTNQIATSFLHSPHAAMLIAAMLLTPFLLLTLHLVGKRRDSQARRVNDSH